MPRFQKDSMVDQKWPEVPKYKQPNFQFIFTEFDDENIQTFHFEGTKQSKF